MNKKLIILLSLILVICMTQCVSGPSPLEESLVGHWTFDDGSGAILSEESGKSVDGEIFGDPVWEPDGKVGGALLFDGSDDNILIDGDFYLPVYTMSIWIKAEFLFRHADVLSAYAEGVYHGVLIEVRDEGIVRFLNRFPLGGSGGASIYSEAKVNDNEWHHIAIVNSSEEMILYLDGIPVASAVEYTGDPEENMAIVLGVLDLERDVQRQFKGSMDELKIFSVALSEKEIKMVMGE